MWGERASAEADRLDKYALGSISAAIDLLRRSAVTHPMRANSRGTPTPRMKHFRANTYKRYPLRPAGRTAANMLSRPPSRKA
jgi:hypothetical protein